jgi:hypothetical protein
MKKKHYIQPKTQVVLLQHSTSLLNSSPESYGSQDPNNPYDFG